MLCWAAYSNACLAEQQTISTSARAHTHTLISTTHTHTHTHSTISSTSATRWVPLSKTRAYCVQLPANFTTRLSSRIGECRERGERRERREEREEREESGERREEREERRERVQFVKGFRWVWVTVAGACAVCVRVRARACVCVAWDLHVKFGLLVACNAEAPVDGSRLTDRM